jgi:hypothetical protein
VRGVGHERALTIEGGLGLLPRRPELAQHVLERVGEVGYLVVGAWLGQRDVRVARARHLAGSACQPGDRAHGALSNVESAEEGEQGAAEHSGGEEQADAVDRAIDRRLRLGELNPADGLGQGVADRPERARSGFARQDESPRDDPVAGEVGQPFLAGLGQRQQALRVADSPVAAEDPNLRTAGGRAGERFEVDLGAGLAAAHVQPVDEIRAGGPQVVVEAGPDALLGHRADHHREHAEDPERQRGRDHGELEADRQARPHASLST